MTNNEFRAIGFSVLAAAAGLAAAVVWQEAHLFGRSGALVTVVAIVFASLKLSDRAAKALAFVHENFQMRRADFLSEVISSGRNHANAEAALQKLEAEMMAEVAQHVHQATRRLLRVEVSMLIAGTLLWGFGDLPLDAYFKREMANQSSKSAPTGAAHIQWWLSASGRGYVKTRQKFAMRHSTHC